MSLAYGAVILEHFRRPRNQRALDHPTVSREGRNPLCGDVVRIELRIENDTIVESAFTANACAICTASASLLTEMVRGAAIARARAFDEKDVMTALGEESSIPAGRVACAVLPLRTLRDALAAL